MCKRRFWKWTSLSIEGPTGGPGGVFHLLGTYRDSRRGLWKSSVTLYGSSVRGIWREGSFTVGPEGCMKEGYGDRHLSP